MNIVPKKQCKNRDNFERFDLDNVICQKCGRCDIERLNSIAETTEHRETVETFMVPFIHHLQRRAVTHDQSKLEKPEVDIFAKYTAKLKKTDYGSEEYKQYLKEMKPALDHHYKVNRHHPEHFKMGIMEMTLIDLIEMLCDWKAATLRHETGDIYKSVVVINKERFGYEDPITRILLNTLDFMEKHHWAETTKNIRELKAREEKQKKELDIK